MLSISENRLERSQPYPLDSRGQEGQLFTHYVRSPQGVREAWAASTLTLLPQNAARFAAN